MPRSPALTGLRVTLRAPRPDDVKGRVALGRDPDIARMFGAILPGPMPVTEDEAADWLDHLTLQEHGWMIETEGRLIGSVFLHGLDPTDRRARLALGILAADRLGQGLGREVVRLVLGYAFGALGLIKMMMSVDQSRQNNMAFEVEDFIGSIGKLTHQPNLMGNLQIGRAHV